MLPATGQHTGRPRRMNSVWPIPEYDSNETRVDSRERRQRETVPVGDMLVVLASAVPFVDYIQSTTGRWKHSTGRVKFR